MTSRQNPKPDLGANQEGHHPGHYLSVPVLARQAAILVADKNLPISGSRVRKLVRRFVEEGRTDVDFRTWFIGYADPTGETAVRNVMRGRDRRPGSETGAANTISTPIKSVDDYLTHRRRRNHDPRRQVGQMSHLSPASTEAAS